LRLISLLFIKKNNSVLFILKIKYNLTYFCSQSLKQSLRQSLRQHQWDSNTRYRDSKRFEDGVPLGKDIIYYL
jgi:hypothetical protein